MKNNKKIFETQCEDMLNLTPLAPKQKEEKEVSPVVHNQNQLNDVDEDYKKVRETYHDMLDIAKDHLENIGDIAESEESARHYEVFFNGIKIMSDLNEKIMIHQQNYVDVKNKIENVKENSGPDVVNNTLVLTTEQLQEFLEKKNKNA